MYPIFVLCGVGLSVSVWVYVCMGRSMCVVVLVKSATLDEKDFFSFPFLDMIFCTNQYTEVISHFKYSALVACVYDRDWVGANAPGYNSLDELNSDAMVTKLCGGKRGLPPATDKL